MILQNNVVKRTLTDTIKVIYFKIHFVIWVHLYVEIDIGLSARL